MRLSLSQDRPEGALPQRGKFGNGAREDESLWPMYDIYTYYDLVDDSIWIYSMCDISIYIYIIYILWVIPMTHYVYLWWILLMIDIEKWSWFFVSMKPWRKESGKLNGKKKRWDTWLSSMGNMRRHEETTYMRIKSGDPPKAAYQGSFSCPPSFSPKYQLNGDFLSHGGTPQIKPDYFSIEAFETHGLGDLSFHESPKWACYQYRALILIGEILKFYLRHLWFQPILWRRCVLESW